MVYETISFSVRDSIATLMLNRPQVMNALSSRMRSEITEALNSVSDEVRCVVMTGAGAAFCSGQDLSDAAAAADIEGTLRREYEPMLQAVIGCAAPVIAAVNGPAAGAGANLALAADVVIAVESAYFSQAFTKIGLIPDAGGTWILPRLVGNARAMGMMLFADKVPARKAEEWGMIWEAVAENDFVSVVEERARQLASGPTGAYLKVRRALRESGANDFAAQLALEAELQGEAGRSPDFREGVAAFLQKRAPRFTGR
ncbi:2-(1,2-epoxy-1,2-dihydrophenyl)acetyl-CoA isomerase [Paracoccus aurantiacus]|uniref:2-(1,2-epoxy-1,2-dihydrophenyl)acetyl-CoA isomerase n=1 Tax=Paracoccus aurantiacus TaxID=2599412 RepID=A0A5C6SBK5_9RHOB|nr:enoyl-CoA hydratase-related protein [Paracoccus aurantiacus]TXB71005.1 2-(1,2-epoxy-1,2-dihydrophenyl)acetyl-CoA isomerase [Paracoccus aurantiacus]